MNPRKCTLLKAMFLCAILALVFAHHPMAQAADDRSQIEQAARDYIEGWYTADAARMERALHPELIKRYIESQADGHQVVKSLNRDQMVEYTRNGGGSQIPEDKRDISVEVLDISGNIAAAKTVSAEYIDMLTLAKTKDQWVIVNILWCYRPTPK